MALMVKAQECGDNVGWHFDGCESVVSIMLQASVEGGAFEYVPFIRSETDENYGHVQAVFEGTAETALVKQVPMQVASSLKSPCSTPPFCSLLVCSVCLTR